MCQIREEIHGAIISNLVLPDNKPTNSPFLVLKLLIWYKGKQIFLDEGKRLAASLGRFFFFLNVLGFFFFEIYIQSVFTHSSPPL